MINKFPKITIVTVCYNVRDDLSKTIDSVISQKYQNIEYIIVDGGSSDGSRELLKQKSDYISHWISEQDNGIYDAMNKGIDLATGDWIIFMNAGDIFFDNHVIEKIFAKEYSKSIGIIYGDVELDFGRNRKIIKSFRNIPSKNVASEICHQGVFTRTSILKQIKYDTTYRIYADINSFWSIYNLNWMFEYVPIVISTFEITGGISSNKPFLSFKEISRLNSTKKFSIRYLKDLFNASYKYFLLQILPKQLYDTIRYKILIRNKTYKFQE